MKKALLFTLVILPQLIFAQFISRGTGVTESDRIIISLSAVDAETVWGVTVDGGTFVAPTNEWMRTTDGGETWTTGSLPFSNPSMATYTIHALSAETAFVGAGKQPNFSEGAIYKTTNGGQSWTEQATFDDRSPGAFIFWGENEGMTFGFARTAPNEVVIYRTEDGGDNWQTIQIPGILPGEWCGGYSANGLLDSQGDHVWITTILGRVLHSADRGLSWEAVQVAPAGRALLGVAFSDEMNGIAVSPALSSGAGAPNMAFRTYDGGATWAEISVPASPTAGGIEYVPGTASTFVFTNLIFGDREVAFTLDGGDHWNTFDGPGIWGMHFLSPTVGWAGGEISSANEGGMYRFVSSLATDHADISTIAGSGTEGYRLGAARNARFYNPKGLAVDEDGNIYVADEYSNSVKKISTDGQVSLLAGGNALFDRTVLDGPDGLLIDADGNLLVTDAYGGQIKKIDLSGSEHEVSLWAGTGEYGLDDGPLAEATFSYPTSLAMDGEGNIYVGDDNAIRKITPDGMVSTLAGSLAAGFANGNGADARFNLVWGIDADLAGNVYAADAFNHSIRKISPDGEVTTLAGNGSSGYQDGASARFNYPEDVAVDTEGNVYVADGINSVIRKIRPDGTVSTAAGKKYGDFFVGENGPEAIDGDGRYGTFSRMRGILLKPDGGLLLTEWGTDLVREVTFGKPSNPLVVTESTIINPYLIGHIRHLKPYDFYGLVQNTSDFPIGEVKLRVVVRKEGAIKFIGDSETIDLPANGIEVFYPESAFEPIDTGVYEVEFRYLQGGKEFYTKYRDITITDQSFDYGDGLPYLSTNYANFTADFKGGYAVDYQIETPDSLSAIEVGFGGVDSTVAYQYAAYRLENGAIIDTVFASGFSILDSLEFNGERIIFRLPEAVYLNAGQYLFSLEEASIGNTFIYVDNDVTHNHNWIKWGTDSRWAKVSDALATSGLPFIIRPIFGNPEIISSARTPLRHIPQVSAYPNPFTESVALSLPAEAPHFCWVEVINLEGRRIDFFQLQPGETVSKDWGDLPSGIYFLHCDMGGQRGALRLVKN